MASERVLLPVARVPPLDDAEAEQLRELIGAGGALTRSIEPADPNVGRAGAFLYRRWVLEVLVTLRLRGPSSFNDIKHELGGLHSESLAPKLHDVVLAGLVHRSGQSEDSPRITYSLTLAGSRVGTALVALTLAKAEHMRSAGSDRHEAPAWANAQPPSARDAMAAYERAASAFVERRSKRMEGVGMDVLATARRMSEACVRKWHGPVLLALGASGGQLTFRDLQRATGAGDQALANALAGLARLRSISRVGGGSGGGAWAIMPLGLADLSLGAPPLVITASLHAF